MITLDGKKISEFGMIVQPGHEHPMTPELNNLTLEIPGRDGIWDFGSEIRERNISIPLILIESDKVAKQQRLREFVTFLFDSYGKPKTLKLIFDYEPDKFYKVRCTERISPDRVLNTGSFALNLTAYDPYAYSTVYSDELIWGNEAITFESFYPLGHTGTAGAMRITSTTVIDLYVNGIAIKPIIEIKGTATNLDLAIDNYRIEFPNFTSKTWSIDCEKYTVIKNGANAFGEINLREFILMHGNNKFWVIGDSMDITVRVKYRDKYL